MILSNADPVILLYFANKLTAQQIAGKTANPYGTPIPVYLSEKLTGLYVDTEEKALAISTERLVEVITKDGQKTRGEVKIQQKGETQTTDINIIGRRDSIGLNVFLPLFQTIYDKVISEKDYRIAYFHQNILIFDARLANLTINQSRENTLVTIKITLEVTPEQEKEKDTVTSKLGYSADSVPVGA